MSTPISKITEQIYVGDSRSAREEHILRDNGITAVVNMAKDLNDPWFPGIKSYKIGLMDGPDPDNYVGYYLGASTCLEILFLGPEEKILIHCHEGRSRSAAIACIVMAELWDYTLEEAEERLKGKRPEIYIKEAHRSHMDRALRSIQSYKNEQV